MTPLHGCRSCSSVWRAASETGVRISPFYFPPNDSVVVCDFCQPANTSAQSISGPSDPARHLPVRTNHEPLPSKQARRTRPSQTLGRRGWRRRSAAARRRTSAWRPSPPSGRATRAACRGRSASPPSTRRSNVRDLRTTRTATPTRPQTPPPFFFGGLVTRRLSSTRL
jgi:hypothetical protein